MTTSLFKLAIASHQVKGNLPFSYSVPKRKESPLEKTLSLIALGLIAFPLEIASSLVALAIGFFFRHPHLVPDRLLYEVAIADLIVRDSLSKTFPFFKQGWWNFITDNLILGGVPLSNRGHQERLRDLGVGAVCAILEDEEAERKTILSQPVSPGDWNSLHVAFRRFRCTDMEAMDLEELRKSVDWVHTQIVEGKKVYIHCKAGRGRSAVIVICYLIRYAHMSIDEAIRYVSSKRKVVTLRPCQLHSIHQYAHAL